MREDESFMHTLTGTFNPIADTDSLGIMGRLNGTFAESWVSRVLKI